MQYCFYVKKNNQLEQTTHQSLKFDKILQMQHFCYGTFQQHSVAFTLLYLLQSDTEMRDCLRSHCVELTTTRSK